MDADEVLALGLGVTLPWRLGSQHLDTSKSPHELHLHLEPTGERPSHAVNADGPAKRMILASFAGAI
jgi:hypothetical protein